MSERREIFCTCYLWPWLGPRLTTMQHLVCFPTCGFVGQIQLEMWVNAQRDGRPAEYRWRPLFNAAKFG